MSDMKSQGIEQRLQKRTKQLFVWTLAWLLSTALVAFGPEMIWGLQKTYSLLAVAINIVLGLQMVLVIKDYLADLDELQRRVHFNAMAISLGCTMIFASLMGLLEPAGLLAKMPSPSLVLVVMSVSYMVALIVNYRKYQ